jgi:hypothetical protein
MATVKNRIRRLQRQQHLRWCAETIRQFENRSNEELVFFASNGYFEIRNDNKRVVKPEEIRALEKELYSLGRGRTDADLKHYAEHGSWLEREQSLAEE